MNEILQFIGTFASIFSIPLAIILYFKTSDARQNKIRIEIIRSLSYRIGEGKSLDKIEVSSVFNSKVREHSIRKPLFTEVTILEDIIADAVSNPFLTSDQKTAIIKDVGLVLESYGISERKTSQKDEKELVIEYRKYGPIVSEAKNRRRLLTNAFSIITALLSAIGTIIAFFFDSNLPEILNGFNFPTEILASIVVTVFAAIITVLVQMVFDKSKKK